MRDEALATIAGMAIILYLTRVLGFWIVGRVAPSPALATALDRLASVSLIALTAPAVASAGLPGLLAAAIAGVIALRTGSVLAAMLAGMAAIWVSRH